MSFGRITMKWPDARDRAHGCRATILRAGNGTSASIKSDGVSPYQRRLRGSVARPSWISSSAGRLREVSKTLSRCEYNPPRGKCGRGDFVYSLVIHRVLEAPVWRGPGVCLRE